MFPVHGCGRHSMGASDIRVTGETMTEVTGPGKSR